MPSRVCDTADLAWFILLTSGFLFLTWRSVESRRWRWSAVASASGLRVQATVVTPRWGHLGAALRGAMQTRVAWDWTDEAKHADLGHGPAALLDADGEPVMVTAFTRGTPDAASRIGPSGTCSAIGTQSQTGLEGGDFDQGTDGWRLGVASTVTSSFSVAAIGSTFARDLFRSSGSKDNRQTRFLGRHRARILTAPPPKRRVVYALSGHGERAVEGRGPEDSDLSDALDLERYELSSPGDPSGR